MRSSKTKKQDRVRKERESKIVRKRERGEQDHGKRGVGRVLCEARGAREQENRSNRNNPNICSSI